MRQIFSVAYQRRCVGMVDKMDLESIVERRASSSLATDTIEKDLAVARSFSICNYLNSLSDLVLFLFHHEYGGSADRDSTTYRDDDHKSLSVTGLLIYVAVIVA